MNTKQNISYVSVDQIKPSSFNPPVRIQDNSLSALVASMQKDGFWEHSPILITDDFEIGDGHRRFAAAKKVGIRDIPVLIVSGKSAKQIWSEYNSTSRPVSGREWLYAYANGMDILPGGDRRGSNSTGMLRKLDDLGEDVIKFCTENNLSPSVYKVVSKICSYVGDNSVAFRRRVLFWVITTKSTRLVTGAMADDIPVDKLLKFIEDNVQVRRPSW